MKELDWQKSVAFDASGPDVKRIQEWLGLQGFGVRIDGQFGAATRSAVQAFQQARNLPRTGVVDEATFAALTAPMAQVLKKIDPAGRSLSEMVLAYAEQHLAVNPQEIGGANCGPWVRFYMGGHEGIQWLWCAGFVGFVLRQAAESLNVPVPIELSYSCDLIAASAKQHNIFLSGTDANTKNKVRPGHLFLVRRVVNDWQHIGIVRSVDAAAGTFTTVEGNSNDDGSRNGHEVASNTRAFAGRDFVAVG